MSEYKNIGLVILGSIFSYFLVGGGLTLLNLSGAYYGRIGRNIYLAVFILPLVYSLKLFLKRFYLKGSLLLSFSFLYFFGTSLTELYFQKRTLYYTESDMAVFMALFYLPLFLLSTIYSIKLIKNKKLKFGILALILSLLMTLYILVWSFLMFMLQGLK